MKEELADFVNFYQQMHSELFKLLQKFKREEARINREEYLA